MTRPDDAWWDEAELAWVQCGRRDGRLDGDARYWNADGELISEARYVDGVVEARRWLRPVAGRVPGPLERAPASVVVYERIYEAGDSIGERYRDAEGREVDLHGRPPRARPAGVPPTAGPMGDWGWLFMRRRDDVVLETREFRNDGTLHRESRGDDYERELYANGVMRWEGGRIAVGAGMGRHGLWRYQDAGGTLVRESGFERGIECVRTWYRPGGSRSGPVDGDREVGTWVVRDAAGTVVETVELGPAMTDEQLLAGLGDEIAVAGHGDDPASVLARIRAAGRSGDATALGGVTSWLAPDEDGRLVALASHARSIAVHVHALRWSLDAAGIAGLAERLFCADRPAAALDLIDAALLVGDEPSWHAARAGYLRALGRDAEAEATTPGELDARAIVLLHEIRAAPEDDGPRLVFADHVAARYPEHAELIVAQCRGLPDADVRARFDATLPEDQRDRRFERGFATDRCDCPAETFLAHHELLFRINPANGALSLQYASGHVAQLAMSPALRRYTDVRFYDTYLHDGAAAQLARSPHLGQLAYLGLRDTSLDDDMLRAILTSRAYPRLTGLDLGNIREGQDYTLAGLEALPDALFAGALRSLDLDRMWFDDEVVEVIARLPALVELSLSSSRLGDAGMTAFAALPQRFTSLRLDDCGFGEAGAVALAASPVLSAVTYLDLEGNELGERGHVALVRSPHLGPLRTFTLARSRASAEVARAIAASNLRHTLEDLNLSRAAIGADGAVALATTGFARLARLGLHGNRIEDRGAVALIESPVMATLRWLDLSSNDVGDATARALLRHARPEQWIELGRSTISEPLQAELAARFGRVQLRDPRGR
jgi:uncharacterized protein (TIGR02996 family)